MLQEHIQQLVNIGYALANIQADLDDGNMPYEQWDKERTELRLAIDAIAMEYAPDYEDDPQYWTRDALQ
jgi:hypothetical protein